MTTLDTSAITNAVASANQSSLLKSTDDTTSISMDDFLKILSASMQNPSIDGDSSSGSSGGTDYISQMAQIASLDQFKKIGDDLSTLMMINQQQQAFGLMGKTVKLSDEDSQATVTGKVEKVRFANGFATLVVNGKEYAMSAIQEVDNN